MAKNVTFTCFHFSLKKVTNVHLSHWGTKLAKCFREKVAQEEIKKRSETLTHMGNSENGLEKNKTKHSFVIEIMPSM